MYCIDPDNRKISTYSWSILRREYTLPVWSIPNYLWIYDWWGTPSFKWYINLWDSPFINSLPTWYSAFNSICGPQFPQYTTWDGQKCTTVNFASWYTRNTVWGTLPVSTISETSEFYDKTADNLLYTFKNIFWANWFDDTWSNSYTLYWFDGVYGTWVQKDYIKIFNSKTISNTWALYNWSSQSSVESGSIELQSLSWAVYNAIEYVEFKNATFSGDKSLASRVDFYGINWEKIWSEYMSSSGTSLVARMPYNTGTNPVKIRIENFSILNFTGINIWKITTTSARTSCIWKNANCTWRSTNWTAYECVNRGYWDNARSEDYTQGCESSWTTCRMIEWYLSWSVFLWDTWVKASILVWWNWQYTLDWSGNIIFSEWNGTINGVWSDSVKIECDTSGLSWYEVPFKYLDCEWNKISSTTSESVNAPVKLWTEATQNVLNNTTQSGSNSIADFIWYDDSITGATIPEMQWIQNKNFSDIGRWWMTQIITVSAFLMLFIFLTFLIQALTPNRKP